MRHPEQHHSEGFDPEVPSDSADLIEPPVDADSKDRLIEEIRELPHAADRFDAGTGMGTAKNVPYSQRFQERPILDGSTQGPLTEATVPNPTRGQIDPAQMKKQPALNTTSTNRWLYASAIAGAVLLAVLLALLRFSEVLAGIGIATVLVGLLLVLTVRASKIHRPARLRIEAVLLALIWIIPLTMIIITFVLHADDIQIWLGWW